MLSYRKIRIGNKHIEAIAVKLLRKHFILLRGKKGYVMCGYLDLKAAEKFKDIAAKITKVATIQQALNATVHSCTSGAKKLGIHKGQPLKETLKIIA